MFDSKQNVPYIYPEKSRDFQLLCSLLNTYINVLRGNTNKMQLQVTPCDADERILSLLSTLEGVTVKDTPSEILRNVLSTFNFAKCHKGTVSGISALVKSVAISVAPDAKATTIVFNKEISNLDLVERLTNLFSSLITDYCNDDKHYISGKLSMQWLDSYISDNVKSLIEKEEIGEQLISLYTSFSSFLQRGELTWANDYEGIIKFLNYAPETQHVVWIHLRSQTTSEFNVKYFQSTLSYVVPCGYIVLISVNDDAPQQITF